VRAVSGDPYGCNWTAAGGSPRRFGLGDGNCGGRTNCQHGFGQDYQHEIGGRIGRKQTKNDLTLESGSLAAHKNTRFGGNRSGKVKGLL